MCWGSVSHVQSASGNDDVPPPPPPPPRAASSSASATSGGSATAPAGRCAHSAVLVGPTLIVFGGLVVGSDGAVVCTNELLVLHTGLNLPTVCV
jgi:hypothetical protein